MAVFTKLNSEIKSLIEKYLESKDITHFHINDKVISPSPIGDYQIVGTKSMKGIFDTDEMSSNLVDFINEHKSLELIDNVEFTKIKKSIHINIHLNHCKVLEQYEPSLGVTDKKLNVLIDYPSPNTAKVLHIGHIRPITIGDCLGNYMETIGHTVKRVSHDGDFGTQFGILINYMLNHADQSKIYTYDMDDITRCYSKGKILYDTNDEFKHKAQVILDHIQNGTNDTIMQIWKHLITQSSEYCYKLFARMNASPDISSTGESFYKQYWCEIKAILMESGVLKKSDGALVIFIDGYEDPLMVEKTNGCITYDTTDIIAIWYRLHKLNMDKIIYLTDSGQNSHFVKIFKLAEQLGWTNKGQTLHHIGFGKVNKPDGVPIRTREFGTIIKLDDVIDAVVIKCQEACASRGRSDELANVMAINSMRYFEMSHPYQQTYNFDLDSMVSFNSDSALYTMYTYARLVRIKNDSSIEFSGMGDYKLTPHEDKLLSTLLDLEMISIKAMNTLEINKLVKFILTLCNDLNSYYSSGKILKDENEAQKVYIVKKCLFTLELLCNLFTIKLVTEV